MATRRKRTTAKRTRKRSAAKRSSRAKSGAGARAIWKGVIRFGSVSVPVKLYTAAQDKSIHFRLLESRTKKPVEQHMVHPETGETVESAVVQRAIQAGRNKLVILEKEELERIEPEPSRDIDVARFVAPEKITHQWYDRPYWVGPDGEAGKYFALVDALRKQEKDGLARWVMRKKEYAGALRVVGDHLMLITLRHAAEVVPASALEPPGGREPGAKEVAMARQLIETLYTDFDVTAYRDEFRDRVMELIEAKAKGKVIRFPKAKPKKADQSLESILARSIEAGKRRKSA